MKPMATVGWVVVCVAAWGPGCSGKTIDSNAGETSESPDGGGSGGSSSGSDGWEAGGYQPRKLGGNDSNGGADSGGNYPHETGGEEFSGGRPTGGRGNDGGWGNGPVGGQDTGPTGGAEIGGAAGEAADEPGTGGTEPGVDPCIAACQHLDACLEGSPADCTDTCADTEGVSEAGARAAAACINALTCSQIENPARTEIIECAKLGDAVGTGGAGGTTNADPCITACRHMAVCLAGSPDDCVQTCAEVDGVTEAEALAAAACIRALTCEQIQDPSGAPILECAVAP